MSNDGRGQTKQQVIDEVCQILSVGPFTVGKGSSEPAQFFADVAQVLGVPSSNETSKPDLARSVVEHAGMTWGEDCDSRNSASGGGSTVTLEGLRVLKRAVEILVKKDESNLPHRINVRPRTGSLKLFKSLTFKAWYALGEFIDNSISSALINHEQLKATYGDDYELKVDITFNEGQNSLTIADNAAGISLVDLDRALKTSEPPPNTARGLGLHGVGLKAAGFWWGQRICIETYPLGSDKAWSVVLDLNELDLTDSETVEVRSIPHRGASGTRVTVEQLWNGIPKGRTLGAIRAFLPSIYRTFLSETKYSGPENLNVSPLLHLTLNGQDLKYSPPKILVEKFWPTTDGPSSSSEAIEWKSDIDIELAGGKRIRGWVGILETMSRDLAGFTLEYRGKSIAGIAAQPDDDAAGISLERGAYKPRKIFGQPGLYADQSIIGSFDLSAFGKSITTDSVTWTAEQEEEFVDAVYEAMRSAEKDFIAQATNLRRRKKNKKDLQSEFSSTEKETTSFIDSLNQTGISHDDPPTSNEDRPTLFDVELTEFERDGEDGGDERIYAIHDIEGHVHEISVRCVESGSSTFLDLKEDQDLGNRITVNLGHRALADLAPIDGRAKTLLVRIVLSLCAAEIFLDGTGVERSKFRRKLNQILEARGRSMHGKAD